VASSDNTKFIYIWNVETLGSQPPKLIDRGGGGLVRFISCDYLVVQTRKGVKLMDPDLKVVTSSNNTLAEGALDVYVATETEFVECFKEIVEQKKRRQTTATATATATADPTAAGEERNPESPLIPAPPSHPREIPRIVVGGGRQDDEEMHHAPNLMDGMFPHPEHSFDQRCFIAVSRHGPDKCSISIYTGESLQSTTPCLELIHGDVEDEFGDEEEIFHTDTIKTFTFLQHEKSSSSAASSSSSASSSLKIPNLHLAASAGDDLTVILWNWRRQQPLCSLQHTQFINALTFLAPSFEAHKWYDCQDMSYLRRKHPSFVENDLRVAELVTCQDADDNNGTTIRVFGIAENPRSFQKRFLAARCGQPVTTVSFDYKMLQTHEISTSKSPNTSSMPRCITARNSDGLVLTGHDNSNEVVFWKWLPERPSLSNSSLNVSVPTLNDHRRGSLQYLQDSDDDDGDDEADHRFAKKEPVVMCLRPLRRLVSRL
jgi:hypothetical protein